MPLADRTEYNAYMNNYMTRRYHRRRAMAIDELGGRCVDCGTDEDLEFDHADRTSKVVDIARRLSGLSETKFREELKKLVLRCTPCHIEKSRRAGDYHKRGCRCELHASLV